MKNTYLSNCTIVVCVILLFSVAGSSYGITLGELSSTSGDITQGNIIFNNFDIVSPNNVTEGSAFPGDVSEIDVQGITIDGNHGLRFTGPFSATTIDQIRAFGRYNFFYDATSLSPSLEISGIGHEFSIVKSGDATGQIVTRTGLPSEPPFVQLVSDALETGSVSDSANLRDPLAGLDVTANSIPVIEFWTFQSSPFYPQATDGNIQINYIDVIFIQQPIPIPPAFWLFGSGLLGLIGLSRRKKAA